jgi:DNA-binding winged helix-turn-helix (wHTH) protein
LEALFQNTGHVLTSQSLITRVWGPEGATPEMLKQLIYRLRVKLNAKPSLPIWIRNVRDEGYALEAFPEN